MRFHCISFLLLIVAISPLNAQTHSRLYPIHNLVIKSDSGAYSLVENAIKTSDGDAVPFYYQKEDQVCEGMVFLQPMEKEFSIRLLASGDYELIDSLLNINNEFFRFKVRFNKLTQSQFLQFLFAVKTQTDSMERIVPVRLYPFTKTTAWFYPQSDELFIGEEKVFELFCNNPANIRITNEWTNGKDIDYMLSQRSGQILLHLIPRTLGRKTLEVQLQSFKPWLNQQNNPVYEIPAIQVDFTVKSSRLAFLNMDQKEITMDEKTRVEGIEIQMDDNRSLVMNKTYRVENREKPGGALIAEIFPMSNLANNKVLCLIRPYNYHRNTDGYLYLKDGDDARFITNVSITPKTTIQKIYLMHEGGDWTDNLTVYPGETINIKLEGEALHKARFVFEEAIDVSSDSLLRSENRAFYKIKIPVNISKRRIELFNHGENTGISLAVKEYQIARTFDYMYINYGDIDRSVATLKSPVIYPQNVKDITFSFIPRRIDEDQLYGKQYLKIDVKITNDKNQLVELKTIDNIAVCPAENSPRYPYYGNKDCFKNDLSLNSYLSRKTYDLEGWAKIELNIENKADKYAGEINTKKIELILQKKYKFDLDVSFPAGLITVTKDTTGKLNYGGLYGISMAIIGQFSFYQADKIGKLEPYKFGAGFIAMDAFNFSDDARRDIGLVVLGSISPTNRESKFSFPIYLGAGYLLKKQQAFFLLGPGIRVSL